MMRWQGRRIGILVAAACALAMLAGCDRSSTSEGNAAQSAAGGSADEGKAARSAGK